MQKRNTDSVVSLPSLQKRKAGAPELQRAPGKGGLQKAHSEPQLRRHDGSDVAAALTHQDVTRLTWSQPDQLPQEARRKVLELLTNPQIQKIASDLYHAQLPKSKKQLDFHDLRSVLRSLTKRLGLPSMSNVAAEKLFKRFDHNSNNHLSFETFYELFVSCLRRLAFDQEQFFARSVFAAPRQTGKVWDVYDVLKKLGTGSFGSAYLCRHKHSGDERVVKSVEKSNAKLPIEDIEREIMVMQQIDHPHVVRLYEWYEGQHSIYLVLDCLKGGTLREVVLKHYQQKGKGMRETWIRKVLQQVVEAIAYIHGLGLIHKDLKDDNIMMLKQDEDYDHPFVVIIDLGVAEMFSHKDPHGKLVGGTPATMAPEVWKGNFGPKCDVFSAGCILFELLSGSMPFVTMSYDPKDWVRLHKKGPDWSLIKTSDLGQDLCKQMLIYRDTERPSMKQCLKHEWFSAKDDTIQSAVHASQFSSLRDFCDMTELKRAVLMEVAARLPMERADQIVRVFQSFDHNRDGGISKKELKLGFKQMGLLDQNLLDKTFSSLDVDGNGILSFREFCAGVLLIFKDLLEARFRALFRKFDANSDGYMSKEEAEAFLSSLKFAKQKNRKDKDRVLGLLYDDGSDKVGYEEFRRQVLPI